VGLGASLYRRLFAHRLFRGFNTTLHGLALHGLGVMNWQDDAISGERHLIREYLPRVLPQPHPVFFDVGANTGAYTSGLLVRFPSATIYAFEPHPQNFARLTRAGHAPDRVRHHNLALGRASGQLTLYDRADHQGSAHASVFQDVIAELHQQAVTATEVRVDTLDNVAAQYGLARIDYLKIDTEGNELAVLEGGARLLGESRIGYIHFEFNEMNVVSRVFLRDFRKLLPGHRLHRLLPHGLLPLGERIVATEIFAYQNILAVPSFDWPAR
jgi:FkbM family methyltransferase